MEKVRLNFKNNKVAYLWPEKPFVLAGSIILDDVIDSIYNKIKTNEICANISSKYNLKYEDVSIYVSNIINSIKALDEKNEQPIAKHNLSMGTFNITTKCNLSCKHCYAAKSISTKKTELKTTEIPMAIANLSKMITEKPKLLIFSGGEPTLEIEKLIIAIKEAAKYNFNIRLNSNGLILSEDLIDVLKNYNVITQISIDGASETTHQMLRGHRASLERSICTAEILSYNKCRVSISMTTHKDNKHEIADVLNIANNIGAEQFITSNLVISGSAKENALNKLLIKDEFEILYNLVKDNKKFQQMTKSTLLAETINAIRNGIKFINCGTGICTCCIDSNGDVYPCINMVKDNYKIINILDENSIEKWHSSVIIKELHDLSVNNIETCQNCSFRYFCGAYCRGETIDAGKTLYSPYIRCKEWKQALLKVIEILCEYPNLYNFEV